jgi:hypothetical protein
VATPASGLMIAYAPPFAGDHAAARFCVDGAPWGPWSDPIWINYPAAACRAGCRAPIFQPALDDGDELAFTYFANSSAAGHGGLRLGRVCWRRFIDADATCP